MVEALDELVTKIIEYPIETDGEKGRILSQCIQAHYFLNSPVGRLAVKSHLLFNIQNYKLLRASTPEY